MVNTTRWRPLARAPLCLLLALRILPAEAAEAAASPAWSGYWAGIDLGVLGGDDEAREINGARRYFADFRDFSIRLQGGRNWQHGRLVAGVTAEAGYLDARTSVTRPVIGGSLWSGAELGLHGGVTGRLGVLAGPHTLAYVSTGLVVGELQARTEQTCTGPDRCQGAQSQAVSTAETRRHAWGLQWGAGVEHRITTQVAATASYQFLKFNKELALPPVDGPGWHHHVDGHVLRVGLRYQF